uniref:Tectonic family member 3 n=1 Tax=Nothobranchius korthausae TaxID=1143690 RepID=A0A1A8EUE3_9TELE
MTAGAVDTTPAIGGPFSSATSAPGGSGVTEQATRQPALDSMITTTQDSMVTNTPDSMVTNTQDSMVTAPRDSMVTTSSSISEAPSPTTTVQTVISGEGCLCDLTPDFCDIGCCCDTADCDAADLTTIFTGCSPAVISEVCVEKWLMFRANVDSSLVTVTDTMFCVRSKAAAPQSLPSLHQSPALGDSYHFSPSGHTFIRHSRPFYRADDVIQTFFSNSSVRGLLRQPSAGAASAFCFNRNPARFLRSSSLTCTRMVTPQSCTTDSSLSAHSYTSPMSLIKVPINETMTPSDYLETCDSGCVLPLSLSVQVLWARQGFTDVPQSYILGAKFLFHCQKVKKSPEDRLSLTFSLFTSSGAELHDIPVSSSNAEEVTVWMPTGSLRSF